MESGYSDLIGNRIIAHKEKRESTPASPVSSYRGLRCQSWPFTKGCPIPREDPALCAEMPLAGLSPGVTLVSFSWAFKLLLSSNNPFFHSLSLVLQ